MQKIRLSDKWKMPSIFFFSFTAVTLSFFPLLQSVFLCLCQRGFTKRIKTSCLQDIYNSHCFSFCFCFCLDNAFLSLIWTNLLLLQYSGGRGREIMTDWALQKCRIFIPAYILLYYNIKKNENRVINHYFHCFITSHVVFTITCSTVNS